MPLLASLHCALIERKTPDTLNWNDCQDGTGSWSFTEADSLPFAEVFMSVEIDGADDPEHPRTLSIYPRSGGIDLYYGDVETDSHLHFALSERASTPVPRVILRRDVVGDWRSETEGALHLRDDGTFTIDNGSPALLTFRDDALEHTGTWSFSDEVVPLDPKTARILLTFDGTYSDEEVTVSSWLGLQLDGDGLVLTFRDTDRWRLPPKPSSP
ncbi:hypothetical protein [Microbacterium xylanilyticum]